MILVKRYTRAMEIWKISRMTDPNARKSMLLAASKSGQKIMLHLSEEDILLHMGDHEEVYVYGEFVNNNLAVISPALKEDWQND